ncbi:MAG TPA: YceI family protein [Chitinophagales bacterium]|nr:YceI family protein [Chitinophagales bacterium]
MLLMLFTALGSFFLNGNTTKNAPVIKKVVISTESKMFLEGSTNINLYNCDCQDKFSEIAMTIEQDGSHAVFNNARIKLRTQDFNCHNELYNCNIRKILEADKFPFITVALLETWQDSSFMKNDSHSWFNVLSSMNVTIKQTSKIQTVRAKAQSIGENKFRIVGAQKLHMKDFGIEVPKYMGGLVRVEDEIVFNFDLVVELIK